MQPMRGNPFKRDGKWFWFDESEHEYGPYVNLFQAEEALKNYLDWLEMPVDEDECGMESQPEGDDL